MSLLILNDNLFSARFLSYIICGIFGSIIIVLYLFVISIMNLRVRIIFKRVMTILGIIFCVVFSTELTLSLITQHHVNKQLGFTYATPYTPEGEIFEITKVVRGKTMDKAGLKCYDRVQMFRVTDLYELLIQNQGKEVSIPIKRDKQDMEVRVTVPKLDVPLAKFSFIF